MNNVPYLSRNNVLIPEIMDNNVPVSSNMQDLLSKCAIISQQKAFAELMKLPTKVTDNLSSVKTTINISFTDVPKIEIFTEIFKK